MNTRAPLRPSFVVLLLSILFSSLLFLTGCSDTGIGAGLGAGGGALVGSAVGHPFVGAAVGGAGGALAGHEIGKHSDN
jgi:osmotically inducible lipoprotein OsmB